MIIILSPAKNMDIETPLPILGNSKPLFPTEASTLIAELSQLPVNKLKTVLEVSDKLAQLNYTRFQSWCSPHTTDNSRPAIFTFKGDAYIGLDAFSLTETDLAYAQNHLRVLSGLYGVLRPLDLMQPYRLEMGGKFIPKKSNNMYGFWRDKITRHLDYVLVSSNDNLLINLASNEYSSAIDFKKLTATIITPQFLDEKNGKYKIISSFAKKARGMMTRWLITNRINSAEHLKDFAEAGYSYCPDRSTENQPVFIRQLNQ